MTKAIQTLKWYKTRVFCSLETLICNNSSILGLFNPNNKMTGCKGTRFFH